MFKKNLVIVVGGVISLLIFMVIAGVIIMALSTPPATVGDNAATKVETTH